MGLGVLLVWVGGCLVGACWEEVLCQMDGLRVSGGAAGCLVGGMVTGGVSGGVGDSG